MRRLVEDHQVEQARHGRQEILDVGHGTHPQGQRPHQAAAVERGEQLAAPVAARLQRGAERHRAAPRPAVQPPPGPGSVVHRLSHGRRQRRLRVGQRGPRGPQVRAPGRREQRRRLHGRRGIQNPRGYRAPRAHLPPQPPARPPAGPGGQPPGTGHVEPGFERAPRLDAQGRQHRFPLRQRRRPALGLQGRGDPVVYRVHPRRRVLHRGGMGAQPLLPDTGQQPVAELGGDRLAPLGVTEQDRHRPRVPAQQFAQRVDRVAGLRRDEHRPAAVHRVDRGRHDRMALSGTRRPRHGDRNLGPGAPDHLPLGGVERHRRPDLRIVHSGRWRRRAAVYRGERGLRKTRAAGPAQQRAAQARGARLAGDEQHRRGDPDQFVLGPAAGRPADHARHRQPGRPAPAQAALVAVQRVECGEPVHRTVAWRTVGGGQPDQRLSPRPAASPGHVEDPLAAGRSQVGERDQNLLRLHRSRFWPTPATAAEPARRLTVRRATACSATRRCGRCPRSAQAPAGSAPRACPAARRTPR